MKKSDIGILGVVLGILSFSYQLFFIHILGMLDKAQGGWISSPFQYISNPILFTSLAVTVWVILASALFVAYSRR